MSSSYVFADSSAMIDRLNQLAISVIEKPFFKAVDLPSLKHTCSEAGFLRAVSWLYALYQEAGGVNLKFVIEKLHVFGLDESAPNHNHVNTIHALRTSLQHSLDLSVSRNTQLRRSSDEWILRAIGSRDLNNDTDWLRCLNAIEEEAHDFLGAIHECTQMLITDEYSEILIREWRLRLERYHEPHEFDRVISVTANDLGLEHLDPVRMRKQYVDKWTKQLDSLSAGYDFDMEVRRLVEQSLLADQPIPITGSDIMTELGIPPGRQIRELLSKATQIYYQNPCPKDELLAILRREVSPTTEE